MEQTGMKSLGQLLGTLPTATPQEHPSATPQLGSTSNDGQLTTTHSQPSNVTEISQDAIAALLRKGRENQDGSQKPNDWTQSTAHRTVEFSGADKGALAKTLGVVCALQRQYGKTEAELEALVEGFCWALAGYPMGAILTAIQLHVKKSNNIPTPADIEEILNPKPKELSAAMYVAIKKRAAQGEYIYGSERDYLIAFEGQEMAKARGGSPLLIEAQREVSQILLEDKTEY